MQIKGYKFWYRSLVLVRRSHWDLGTAPTKYKAQEIVEQLQEAITQLNAYIEQQ